jgi:hypothetical protein
MLPVILLASLVMSQAFHKRFWTKLSLEPHLTSASVSVSKPQAHTKCSAQVFLKYLHKLPKAQLFICLFCLLLANLVAAYCLVHSHFDQYTLGETFGEYFRHAFKPMLFALVNSLACTLPIFLVLEVFHIRRNDASGLTNSQLKAHLFVSCSFFATLLLWLVPLLQTFMAFSGLLSGDLDLLKNFFRIGVAMSAIPLAMSGIALACYRVNKTETGAAT